MGSSEVNQMRETLFTVWDFVVLFSVLAISVMTGIYFAQKDRKNNNMENYFYGDRSSSPLVIGMSLTVTFVSGMTTIGYPVEAYLYGTVWFWLVPCFPLVVLITGEYFIPLFFRLRCNCVYEYLEIRFNKLARSICSVFVSFYLFFYMAITVCFPALSLSALTPISLYSSIAITCVLCTFYTVIGGFKSVIWTDVFQAVVMFLGSIVIIALALSDLGGASVVAEAVVRGNRTTFFDFNIDVTRRSTAWSLFIGNFMLWFVLMSTNQADVQRYLSCKSVSDAKKSLLFGMFPQVIITFVSIATGVVAYAYFEHCDPLRNGEIDQNDQLIPLMVGKLTKYFPGVNGLFLATIYCGTFSSVSSGINSTTLIILEDFVQWKWKSISEKKKIMLSKVIGILLGILLYALSMLVTAISKTLVTIAYTLCSSFIPPVTGMFCLGMFLPWTNSKGAISGAMTGFVVVVWLSFGSLFNPYSSSQELSRQVDQCQNMTNSDAEQTNYIKNTTMWPSPYRPGVSIQPAFPLYEISFMYLRLIGFITTILIGTIVSLLTKPNDPQKMNPMLFVPLLSGEWLPRNIREFMRFGVRETATEKPNETEAHLL